LCSNNSKISSECYFHLSAFTYWYIFTVDEGAVLDVQFDKFYHQLPDGFDSIMIEQSLLWNTHCIYILVAIDIIHSFNVFVLFHILSEGRHGHDRMVVEFTTTCAISAYHYKSCEFEPRSWRGVLYTTLCDTACQWFTTGQWFSLGIPVSSTNKTDCHDITEILLKVALNTINQPSYLA
jgi:hypothetical protein